MLIGRLDAWWAASHMLQQHPVTGVGLGAYGAEFIPAKLELLSEGRELYQGHRYGTFSQAHNEYLQVAAELGWPGVIALLWALAHLGIAMYRGCRGDPHTLGLALGGTTLWAVLAVAHFPFHLALTAYPALVFLAWVFAQERAS